MKIGRNERCPCGSGKKYKNCCAREKESGASVQKRVKSGLLVDTTPSPESTTNISYPAIRGWGKDSFSKLLSDAYSNTVTTQAKLGLMFGRLKAIHDAFEDIVKYSGHVSELLIHRYMLQRCHSAYVAAVRLSSGGQVPESYMVLRGCLEFALYSLYFQKHPESVEIWLRRHDNEDSKKAVRAKFRSSTMLKIVRDKDHKLGDVVRFLYEHCIDYGAHPNEKALTSNMDIIEQSGSEVHNLTYISGGDSPAMKLGLKWTAEVGVSSLMIFENIFPEQFRSSGVSAQLPKLRQGL